MIREATEADIPQMLVLAETKRKQYEEYSPVFWRRASDAAEKQDPYFRAQLGSENSLCLVSEDAGQFTGFVIASIVSAPPVYDPGGPVCMVDDFAVADSA